MNSMLIIASLIAVAVATPVHRGLVAPGIAGPAPVVETPISVGPAIIDFAPIAVGPTIVDTAPVSVGPAIIDFAPIAVGPALIDNLVPVNPVTDVLSTDGTPLIQIILNINNQADEITVPAPVVTPVVPEVIVPGPVNIVEDADTVGPVVPSPIVIGSPALPEESGPVNIVDSPDVEAPVVPSPVVIGTPALPEIIAPVQIGTPILPAPAVVLTETLN